VDPEAEQKDIIYSTACNRNIHDECGENECTIKTMCEDVKREKKVEENKAPGENEQTGGEIEATWRVEGNMKVSGTIDDIELRVMLDAGAPGFYNEHPDSWSIVGFWRINMKTLRTAI
jgi:hypothetical protein